MKKTNIRPWFFALLACASILSFVFINTVPQTTSEVVPEVELKIDEPEELEQPCGALPDVEVVRKIIQQGKKILPIS